MSTTRPYTVNSWYSCWRSSDTSARILMVSHVVGRVNVVMCTDLAS